MPSVNDWAAKAAEHIADEFLPQYQRSGKSKTLEAHKERIAAIIATFAEPLMQVLRDSRREHYHCEDVYYCCPLCTCACDNDEEDHEHDDSCTIFHIYGDRDGRRENKCNCGADKHNARLDKVLHGEDL